MLRGVAEEVGLTNLNINNEVGSLNYFHLTPSTALAESWTHAVSSGSNDQGRLFHFSLPYPNNIGSGDMPASNYSGFWIVDDDYSQLNPMYSQYDYGTSFKEQYVDFSGWTCRGNGPDYVTYVATDNSGSLLGLDMHRLYVSH